MGNRTITFNQLYKFLKINDFINICKSGHNLVEHKPTGKKILINWHRSKGKGVSYYDLRDIAKLFNLSKNELVIYISSKMKSKLDY